MANREYPGRDDADECSFEDVRIPLPEEEASRLVCEYLSAAFGTECYIASSGELAPNHGEWLFPLYASADFGRRGKQWLGTACVAPYGGIRTIPDIDTLRKKIEKIRRFRLSARRIQNALMELAQETLQRRSPNSPAKQPRK